MPVLESFEMKSIKHVFVAISFFERKETKIMEILMRLPQH
jgi:hypothetical protein